MALQHLESQLNEDSSTIELEENEHSVLFIFFNEIPISNFNNVLINKFFNENSNNFYTSKDLLQAAKNGKFTKVKQILESGSISINCQDIWKSIII